MVEITWEQNHHSTIQFIFSLKHTSLFMILKIWGLGSICLVRTVAALMILSDNLTLKGQLHGPDMNNKKPTKGSFARKGCNTPPAADNRYMSFLCSVSSPFKLYTLLAWRRWCEAAVASVGFAVHRLDGRGSAGERLKLQFLYLGYGSGMTARKAKKKRKDIEEGWMRQTEKDWCAGPAFVTYIYIYTRYKNILKQNLHFNKTICHCNDHRILHIY